MPDSTPAEGEKTARQAGRGAYAKPVLKVYGDVAAVTSATDMRGGPDGGPNNTRT